MITVNEFGALVLYLVALLSIITNVYVLSYLIDEPKHYYGYKDKKIYHEMDSYNYSYVIDIPQ